MKFLAKKRLQKMNMSAINHIAKNLNNGDTIIEVLFAVAIFSAVIGASFTALSRTSHNARQSQERGEAVKIIKSQAELLKIKRNVITDGEDDLFCINPTTNTMVNAFPPFPRKNTAVPVVSDTTQYST